MLIVIYFYNFHRSFVPGVSRYKLTWPTNDRLSDLATDVGDRRQTTTDASQQNDTGPLGRPVINDDDRDVRITAYRTSLEQCIHAIGVVPNKHVLQACT